MTGYINNVGHINMNNLKILYIKTNQTDSPKYKEIIEKLKK